MNKSPEAFRTIGEVSELLNIPAHVLRFWESRFTQIRPVKRAGGRRYYRPTDVALLSGIRTLLHDHGMSIRGVQKLLREQGVRQICALAEDPSLITEARQEWTGEDTVIAALTPRPPPAARVIPWPGGRDSLPPESADSPPAAGDPPVTEPMAEPPPVADVSMPDPEPIAGADSLADLPLFGLMWNPEPAAATPPAPATGEDGSRNPGPVPPVPGNPLAPVPARDAVTRSVAEGDDAAGRPGWLPPQGPKHAMDPLEPANAGGRSGGPEGEGMADQPDSEGEGIPPQPVDPADLSAAAAGQDAAALAGSETAGSPAPSATIDGPVQAADPLATTETQDTAALPRPTGSDDDMDGPEPATEQVATAVQPVAPQEPGAESLISRQAEIAAEGNTGPETEDAAEPIPPRSALPMPGELTARLRGLAPGAIDRERLLPLVTRLRRLQRQMARSPGHRADRKSVV